MAAPQREVLPPGRAGPSRRLHCFVNGIYSTQLGGGDIYFAHMAQAARAAGFELHFYGGHALQEFLRRQGLSLNLTLTDSKMAALGDVSNLGGQVRLFLDFARRCWNTLPHLREKIRSGDCAYAMSDYWFDSIPLLRCPARAKVLYLGMIAPTLRQVLLQERADVSPSRLASLYYWASQQFSLRAFRRLRRAPRFSGGPGSTPAHARERRKVTYSHPEMREYLRRLGYEESDLALVANGMDVAAADRAPAQPKQFDAVWTGRVHPQKGIDDLLATLTQLAGRVEGFRALVIGRSKDALEPRVAALGILSHVTFAGLVSEEEKFRLLKASRVFVMPSHYESWGIVIGEALACAVPVVAYDLGCYRPVFGDFIRYVPPFDREKFVQAVEREVLAQRAGNNYLAGMDLAGLKHRLSWQRAQESFLQVLEEMTAQSAK